MKKSKNNNIILGFRFWFQLMQRTDHLTRKQKEKKVFSLRCIQKSNVINKRIWVLVLGFMYLDLADAMD